MKEYDFVCDKSFVPIMFLPADLDRTNLSDITAIGDQYRRYLDQKTGKIHDCREYYETYMQNAEAYNVICEYDSNNNSLLTRTR